MPSAATNEPRPVIIISDLAEAVDDNIAILMLLRSERVDVRGIITTAGNACAQRGAVAANRLLQGAGATSIPVLQGFPLSRHEERRRYYETVERLSWQRQPYVGAFADAQSCDAAGEKKDGEQPASGLEAVEFLIAQARANNGRLTVVLIGPATMLAEALRREPALARLIHRVNAMGGAITVPGNVTAHAEFNVWFDPEAMETVLASQVPMTLVPLDATQGVTYESLPRPAEDASDFAAREVAARLNRPAPRGRPVGMWDEVLAAIVIDPALVQAREPLYLSVSTAKDDRYGSIVSSSAARNAGSRPVEVVTKVSPEGVGGLLARLLLPGG